MLVGRGIQHKAPVRPDAERAAQGDQSEDARVDHIGEKEHGGAEQHCSEETCPGRKEITARAVDPGESQHAEEQR